MRRTSWTPTLIAIAGLGLLAVALLVVPGLIAPPPVPSAAPRASAGQPTTAVPSTATVSFPPSSFASVDWQISPLGAASESATVLDLVLAGERLVAVGARDDVPLAWWSDDGGATWSAATGMAPPEPPPAGGAVAVPRAAAASGSRVVAAGFWTDPTSGETLGPVVWTSGDGRAWVAHNLVSSMPGATLDRIVGTPDGFLATGFAGEIQPYGLWFSGDGVAWHEISASGIPDLSVLPPAILESDDRLLVAGGHAVGDTSRPGIWASAGGLDFETQFEDRDVFGWIIGLGHADYGYVAAGQTLEDPADPSLTHLAAWISADGRGWQRLALETPAGTSGSSVAANSSGAVILGWSSAVQAPVAWFLAGGSGSGTPASTTFPFVVFDVVALPDRFVAVGGCPAADGCAGPMIAIGRPSDLAVAPDPTLPGRP